MSWCCSKQQLQLISDWSHSTEGSTVWLVTSTYSYTRVKTDIQSASVTLHNESSPHWSYRPHWWPQSYHLYSSHDELYWFLVLQLDGEREGSLWQHQPWKDKKTSFSILGLFQLSNNNVQILRFSTGKLCCLWCGCLSASPLALLQHRHMHVLPQVRHSTPDTLYWEDREQSGHEPKLLWNKHGNNLGMSQNYCG